MSHPPGSSGLRTRLEIIGRPCMESKAQRGAVSASKRERFPKTSIYTAHAKHALLDSTLNLIE